MPEKKRAKFIKNGFQVFTGSSPREAGLLADMAKKGHLPKRHGEWLAVKRVWIEDTICGDESLPYIPAVRKVKLGKTG